jgi:2Fe-2S ferredoxin
MPFIRFVKKRPAIEVAAGANLMKSLLAADLPVASSCLGDGICGRCRIQILEGKENLSKTGILEEILRDRLNLAREIRISCQTTVYGDILIDASYW